MESSEFRGRDTALTTDAPVIAASLALNILSLTMPIVILLIFDRVIPFQSHETLTLLTLALLISAAMEFALRWSRSVILSAAASEASIANHRRFLSRVLGANPAAFARESPAVHLERFTALGRLRDYFAGQNQALGIDLPFTLVFIVLIGLIGGWLVAVPLVGLVAVLAFAFFIKRTHSRLFKRRKTLDERRYAFLSEVLSSMATVKANTMERQMTRRYELLQEQTADSSHSLIWFSGLAQSYGAILSQLSVAAMGLLGAFLILHQMTGVAELAACMMLNGRIIQPLMKLMTFWVQSEGVAAAKSKAEEINTIETSARDTSLATDIDGNIELSNVTIANADGSGNAIETTSFQVEPGTTAIIDTENEWAVRAVFEGILGQRSPSVGDIYIDEYFAADCTGQHGSDGIVVLEEKPAMLSGTLLENISAFGGLDRIERAKVFAAMLGLEKRIHRLPMGYNTAIDASSEFTKDPINRQLIALVRVLALRPRVLLMNEPTAVLETPERELLTACLGALSPKPAMLIASPDPRIRGLADMIIHLDASEVEAWEHDAAHDRAETLGRQEGAA